VLRLSPVPIDAGQERQFYDGWYAQFQTASDDALVCNLETFRRDISDPQSPGFERRLLHQTALDHLLAFPVSGCNVLDYCCGTGDWGLMLACQGANVTLLDLSPVAIQVALRRAKLSGVEGRVRGVAADASNLACFRDGEFDLIFGSAAVHHTVKYPGAVEELVRVLRPGGRLILVETYGNNRLLNFVRRLRWRISGLADDAGEDVLLSDSDLARLLQHFRNSRVVPLNFLAMAKRLFRGRFANPVVLQTLRSLEAADRALFRICPPLKRYCGEVVVIAEK